MSGASLLVLASAGVAGLFAAFRALGRDGTKSFELYKGLGPKKGAVTTSDVALSRHTHCLRDTGGMLVFGHRGASAQKPENTLSAVRHALALGAHGVEVDIQLSADGQVRVQLTSCIACFFVPHSTGDSQCCAYRCSFNTTLHSFAQPTQMAVTSMSLAVTFLVSRIYLQQIFLFLNILRY